MDSSPIKNADKAMDGVKKSMDGIVKESDKVASGIKKSMKTSPIDKMRSTTEKLKSTIKSVADESSVLGKAMDKLKQTKAIQALSRGIDRVSSTVVKAKEKFTSMNRVLDRIKTSKIGEKVGTSLEKIKGPASGVIEKAKSMGVAFKDGLGKAKEHIKSLGEQLKNIQPKVEKLGKSMMTKVTTPILAGATAGTKMYLDLSHNIKKVTTLADSGILPFDKIKTEVRAISDASGLAQKEIASSVYDSLSAGIKSANVMEFVRSGIDLTRAGFTDLDTVIDATTTVLNAYGKEAFNVGKIHDLFVQTQDKGKISVDELGKNIGRVIPTASSLEVNLDQLGASYSMLTANGSNANMATTNLNAMLEELGKTGSQTDKLLRKVTKKSFKDLIKEGKTVGDVLDIIKGGAEKAGLSVKDMFGSSTAGSAAVSILGGSEEGDFNDYLKLMNQAKGKTAQNAKIMEDELFKIQRATTQVKNTLIDFGAMIAPTVERVATKVSDLVSKFNGLDDNTKQMVGKFALVTAAIGPVIWVLSKIIGIGSLVTSVIGGIGGAIGFILSPAGLVLGVILALVATLIHLWRTNEGFRDAVIGIWESIQTHLGTALEYIKGLWETHGESIKTTVMNVFNIIQNVILISLAVITGVITVGIEIIKVLWAGFGETIMTIVSSAWSFIQGIISGAMNIIQGIIDITLGIISGNWSQAWNGLVSVFSGAIEIIKSLWQGAVSLLSTPIDAVVNLLDTVFKSKLEGVKKAWNGLKNFLKSPITGVVNLFRRDSGGKADGSHASGAYNIPFDNYMANLHKGEMVLTKSASDMYRAMGGTENSVPTTTTNNYSTSTTTVRGSSEGKSSGNSIVFSPTYNIEISGTATESDKQEIEKVIDKKTRELFNEFFKEMNMKMA